MTQQEIEYVQECIRTDIHSFYVWGKWKAVRRKVLQMDHGECQRCKAKKKYTKATTVHHVNYVKRHPDLALEIWYEWHGVRKRNLRGGAWIQKAGGQETSDRGKVGLI